MASVFKSRSIAPGANTAQAEIFNWEDVTSKAKDYLASVREQAQQLVRESQLECERLRAEAEQQGMESVQSQVEFRAQSIAQQIADERMGQTTQSIGLFCKQLEDATEQWLRQWQHETISLSIAIAEKLMARQMEADPSILLDWIHDSVRLVAGQRNITIRIHPTDAERISDGLSFLVNSSGPNTVVQVSEEVEVGRFGVILQTADTTIDRTMRTQLRRLTDELH